MIPMYLDGKRKEPFLYNRLDGQPEDAGRDGIEKHGDFTAQSPTSP